MIEARRLFPHAPEPFIDLSTGINPHAYPFAPLDPEVFTRLPEPEALDRLQEVAATAYGACDPDMVAAAPGTQILISLLPHLLGVASRHATILGPTYGEHEAAWRAAGADVVIEQEPTAFRQRALATGGVAILCNPNNPDGRLVDPDRLLGLAQDLAVTGGLLICDEAFADLETPNPGLSRHLPHPGLLVLRSFGKSYGLAGLRLGFLLANPDLARRIRASLGPWAVAGPALEIGRAALADAAWRPTMTRQLQQSCHRLEAMMTDAGFARAGGTRLFCLFRGSHARSTFVSLGQAGILTRRFTHDPDLLRFGLPGPEPGWLRLQEALKAIRR